MAEFAKDLVGEDFLKFKITLQEADDEDDNRKLLILVARKEATSLAKLKEKISQDFVKTIEQDATERPGDAANKKVKETNFILAKHFIEHSTDKKNGI